MTGFNFPNSPTEGQTFSPAPGVGYRYTSGTWRFETANNGLVYVGTFPPSQPVQGQLWFDSGTGDTFLWYEDIDSGQWVQVNVESGSRVRGYAYAADYGDGIEGLKAAWAVSKRVICTPGVNYIFTNDADTLKATGEDVHIVAPFSTFQKAGLYPCVNVIGGWPEIQNVSAVAGRAFTVSDGTKFLPGSVVKTVDEQKPWHTLGLPGDTFKQGEFNIVESVAGNVATLAISPYYTYLPASTARMALLSPKTCRIDVGDIIYTGSVSGSISDIFITEAWNNPDVKIGNCAWFDGTMLSVFSCFGGNHFIKGLYGGPSASSYGIAFRNSENGLARVATAGKIRHVTDHGTQDVRATEAISLYGHARGNKTIETLAIGTHEAAFTSHQGGIENEVINCTTFRCKGHSAWRGIGNKTIGGSSNGDVQPFGAFVDSNYVSGGVPTGQAITDKTLIQDTVIRDATGTLLTAGPGAGAITVNGGDWHGDYTAVTPSRLFEAADGSLLITGRLRLSFKGTIGSRVILALLGTTRIEVDGMTLDARAGVIGTNTELVGDPSAYSPVVIVHDFTLLGNTLSQVLVALYDGALVAGCRFGNIKGEQLAGVVGGKTVAEVQPFIDGPIVGSWTTPIYKLPGFGLSTSAPGLYTIAAGAFTAVTSYCAVDTEALAATDDLDTINGGVSGDIIYLEALNGGRDIVVRHGTGNIFLVGAANYTLVNTSCILVLRKRGTQWLEVSRATH